MEKELLDRFIARKEALIAHFVKQLNGKDYWYPSYEDLLRNGLECAIEDGKEYGLPDPSKIHTIDDGDYQGTYLFIIPEKGYQPSKYWATTVYYGSCSGCDTLQATMDLRRDNEKCAGELWTLTLHMLQKMKEIGFNEVSESNM